MQHMELIKEQTVQSYGLMSTKTKVCKPASYEDVLFCLGYAKRNGLKICPAGGKMSFSNVCLISHQLLLDMTQLNKVLDFDNEKALITVQAGTKITDILIKIRPFNLSLIGLTGSQSNTVGGNISSDVNGKDSWRNGNFSENICSMKVLLVNGEILQISKTSHPDLYHALVGGLGLIGIILEVTLALQAINSSILQTQSVKLKNITHLLEEMDAMSENEWDFAYCWTNPFAKDNKLGSGICEKALYSSHKHISFKKNDVYFKAKKTIFGFSPKIFWSFVKIFAGSWFFKLSSHFKYLIAPKNNIKHVDFYKYQYPMLKYFPQWNLKFAPKGFREWQILFPKDNFVNGYSELLKVSQEMKFVPNICAVRKHKRQNSYLSFAGDGYSLTLNYGLGDHKPERILKYENCIKGIVFKYSGKVYLAKFPFFNEDEIEKMYPDFKLFKAVKLKYDANNVLVSDSFINIFK